MHELFCVPSLSISYYPTGKKGLATRINATAKLYATVYRMYNKYDADRLSKTSHSQQTYCLLHGKYIIGI